MSAVKFSHLFGNKVYQMIRVSCKANMHTDTKIVNNAKEKSYVKNR